MLIDAHCHIYELENISEVISKSEENGINAIINNAVDLNTSIRSVDIASKYAQVFTLVGLHPENVEHNYIEEISKILELLHKNNPKIIGIGEIGLDYLYGDTVEKRNMQKRALEAQLEFAEKNELPVAIHSRRAKEDVLDILGSYKLKVHMHGFTASKILTETAVDRGYYISFIPNTIFEKDGKRYVKRVPIDKLLLETDTPVPLKGISTTPALISEIRNKVAEIKGMTPGEVEKTVQKNTFAMYPQLAKVL